MIARKDNNRLFPLTAVVQKLQQSGKLIVDLSDHRIVIGLHSTPVKRIGMGSQRLKGHIFQTTLLLEIAVAKVRTRHIRLRKPVRVTSRWNEGRMGVIGIECQKPRLITWLR